MIDLIKTYAYDQLDWQAREKAVNDFAVYNCAYDDWHEFIYDDLADTADRLGIDYNVIWHTRKDGSQWREPDFQFDEYGFSFSGKIILRPDTNFKAAPAELASEFEAAYKKLCQLLFTSEIDIIVSARGRSPHSFLDRVEYYSTLLEDWVDAPWDSKEINCLARDMIDTFTDYAHRLLTRERDWLTSRENIEEIIRLNSYKFTAEGELA